MENKWNTIKPEHIVKAISILELTKESYPKPRNTYLIYNDKKYPAKHIRGMAYKVAFNEEISKNEFSGGKETADFFINLGFKIEHQKNNDEQK